ncbi:hypothetical protein RIF29_48026 [Crotalaria pallida]|uniref:Uncharacterized protein n=1 Tax=Crotalaria pallida TaxID=3830 RepID=A0AAN9HGV4_CROPI
MSYTLVLTFEGGDLEAIPVEVSPMTDFCIRYPNLIRKDIKMNSSSLCRAIRLAKRIDRSILKSIVTPSTGLPRQSQLIKEIVALSKDLILRHFGESIDSGSPGRLSQSTEAGAEKVYPGQRFTRYAILGDDVCIADENVASLYRQTVNDLGLAIRKGASSKLGYSEALTKREGFVPLPARKRMQPFMSLVMEAFALARPPLTNRRRGTLLAFPYNIEGSSVFKP